MQLLFHMSLLLLLLLYSVLSLQCTDHQYSWPFENPTKCCSMCAPGTVMTQDPDYSCDNKCEPCKEGRYMKTYNVKTYCDVCDTCSNPNMERETKCNATQNTVCVCESGYRCKDLPCTVCVKIPRSTSRTTLRSTTASSSETEPVSRSQESTYMVWFLVIPALLCGGILVFVATKIKPRLHRIKGNHGIFPVDKPDSQTVSMEEEEVSRPIQEVSRPIQEVCEESEDPDVMCMKLKTLQFLEG